MKRCIIALCIFCILFSSFTLLASAHPGRTDSNGGHYDHDTGEYHYHTGEYADLHQSSDGNLSYNNSNTYDRVYENGYNSDYRTTYNELSVEDKEENNQKFKSLFHEVVDWIYTILVFAPWVLGIGYLLWAFALSPIIDKLKSKTYKSDIEHLCNNIDKTDSPSFLTAGIDFSLSNTYFSPDNENDPAFITIYTSNDKEKYFFPIYTKNQYVTLMDGEKIVLINCHFENKE